MCAKLCSDAPSLALKGRTMFEKHKAKKLAGSGGVRCRATVLTAERGNTVSGQAMMVETGQGHYIWKLTVRVEPSGQAPFEAAVTAQLGIGNSLAPGMGVSVIYDPNDPSKIAYDQGRDGTVEGMVEGLVASLPGSDPQALQSILEGVIKNPSSMNDTATLASQGQALASAMGISNPTVHVRGQQDLPSSPPAPPEDPVQLLTQLAQLRTQGMLTDAEYETQKARLLGE
jgi:hypothetical protein